MSKLFVFGIGGTGSRVLKSLTMLLMAGVKTNVDQIIPIVIDKDETNGDMVRTKRLIEAYITTRNKFVYEPNKFFSTQVSFLGGNMCLPLKDDKKEFSEYIKYDQLGKANEALVDALFSKKALEMVTTEGFRGIPSIGSVVLNQLEEADLFQMFASRFEDGDKIFIISSIFGGTGASGFPLLVKTLRGETKLQNWDNVRKSPIGAVTVLPYFVVGKPDKKDAGKVTVDPDTFCSKASAALKYYKETLGGQVDEMYYVGDKKMSVFPYSAGGKDQENYAHFVELVAALSIIDFANNDMKTTNNRTMHNEFGIKDPQQDPNSIIFNDLHSSTLDIISNPLIRLYVFKQYMKLVFDKENRYQPWSHNYPSNRENDYNQVFIEGRDAQALLECLNNYERWLKELADEGIRQQDEPLIHTHKYTPFNLTAETFAFVKGTASQIVVKETGFRYKDWAWFDNELNRACADKDTQVSASMTKEQRFLEIFYRAANKFVAELIPNSQEN